MPQVHWLLNRPQHRGLGGIDLQQGIPRLALHLVPAEQLAGGVGAGLQHAAVGGIDHQQDAVRLDRAGDMDRLARTGVEVGRFGCCVAHAWTVPASPATARDGASCPWKCSNMACAAVAARTRLPASGRARSSAWRKAGQPGPSSLVSKWRTAAATSGRYARRWRAISRPPRAEPSIT